MPTAPTHTPARTEGELRADLNRWRRDLLRALRLHNPARSAVQIDDAVQCLLERLVFIRACEDRRIEEPRLLPMLGQADLVARLTMLFREFERVYGGRLFAPHLCEELAGEAAAYERVIAGIGGYDFGVIDADVLGMVYEQSLERQACDLGGRKRARRKARGIYYTPRPVVRYIVAQTVGRLLNLKVKERTGEQARPVKVLDMACGSGSFLIEAFDVLERYSPSPEEVGFGVPPSRQKRCGTMSPQPSPSKGEGEGWVRGEPGDIAGISSGFPSPRRGRGRGGPPPLNPPRQNGGEVALFSPSRKGKGARGLGRCTA